MISASGSTPATLSRAMHRFGYVAAPGDEKDRATVAPGSVALPPDGRQETAPALIGP